MKHYYSNNHKNTTWLIYSANNLECPLNWIILKYIKFDIIAYIKLSIIIKKLSQETFIPSCNLIFTHIWKQNLFQSINICHLDMCRIYQNIHTQFYVPELLGAIFILIVSNRIFLMGLTVIYHKNVISNLHSLLFVDIKSLCVFRKRGIC